MIVIKWNICKFSLKTFASLEGKIGRISIGIIFMYLKFLGVCSGNTSGEFACMNQVPRQKGRME